MPDTTRDEVYAADEAAFGRPYAEAMRLMRAAPPASPQGKPGATGPESPDRSTDAELAALEALCAAATPGPWFDTDQPDGVLRVSFYPLAEDGGIAASPPPDDAAYGWWVEFPGDMEEYEGADLANAAFIAASREAVPRLVAAVRALRTFRDAIDAASVAYHTGAPRPPDHLHGLRALDRAVRVALSRCQDDLDGAQEGTLDAAEFMRRAERVREQIAATLTPEEVETVMQPYRSFGAMMRDNEAEDALFAATLAYGAAHAAWLALVARGGPTTTDPLAAGLRARAAQDALHAAYAAYAGAREEEPDGTGR